MGRAPAHPPRAHRVDEDVIADQCSGAPRRLERHPLARAVARFLDARVAAGERLAADDLEGLSRAATASTRSSPRPANRRGARACGRPVAARRWTTAFFRELGRIVDPVEHAGTIVGSRDRGRHDRRRAVRRAASVRAARRAGKTTLIVEALRRLDGRLAFQATAADVIAGQVYIGMLEGRMQDIVARLAHRPVVWVFPSFEEALWSGQHTQSPRGVLDALLPYVESGEAVVVGEIDPLAYELIIRHRPRVARLFEVVRLTPIVEADALAVARDWAEHNELEVDDETLAEALDLALRLPPPRRREAWSACSSSCATGSRAASPPR